MYRFVFFLTVILSFTNLVAQHTPFTAVRTDFTSFYAGDELYELTIDSFSTAGGDTVFYFNRIIKEEQNMPANCDYYTNDTSWLGTHFVQKANNDALFFNRDGDTIRLQHSIGAVGDTFTLFRFFNGNRVVSEMISEGNEPFLDEFENVRAYELSVTDPAGSPVTSAINGLQYKVSYWWGFKQSLDWWNFPYDTNETITVYAVEDSMLSRVNTERVFSHHLGQEFHYETTHASCGFTGCRTEFSLEKLFVIAKDSAQNGDSLYYSFRRNMITYIDDPVDGLDTTYVVDTISTAIYLPDFAHLDTPTRELFFWNGNPGFAITSFPDSTGPRARKELILDVDYHSGDSCLEDVNLGNPRYIYGDSLGLTYFYDDTGGVSTYERELIYYKKGIEQWGNPIDFDVLLRVPKVEQLRFLVYNSNGLLHVKMQDQKLPALVAVYDLQGRLLTEKKISRPKSQIDISSLPSGVFLIQIKAGSQSAIQKFVK